MWIIAVVVILPFVVLSELLKPKNLYKGGWYSKKRNRRRK